MPHRVLFIREINLKLGRYFSFSAKDETRQNRKFVYLAGYDRV